MPVLVEAMKVTSTPGRQGKSVAEATFFISRDTGMNGFCVSNHQKCVRAQIIKNVSVRGIRSDYAAVQAAFSLEWSNGPVEGHVNRLKFIKRQGYGRASFDLLKRRVLPLTV